MLEGCSVEMVLGSIHFFGGGSHECQLYATAFDAKLDFPVLYDLIPPVL